MISVKVSHPAKIFVAGIDIALGHVLCVGSSRKITLNAVALPYRELELILQIPMRKNESHRNYNSNLA